MKDRRQFAEWTAWLLRKFPAKFPVHAQLVPEATVRRIYGVADAGYSFFTAPRRCVVHVANNLSPDATADCLRHEWTHVLRCHLPAMAGDFEHDAVFWAIYGRIYQEWLTTLV